MLLTNQTIAVQMQEATLVVYHTIYFYLYILLSEYEILYRRAIFCTHL